MLLPKIDTGHGMSTPTPTPPNHPHRMTQNNFYEKKRTLREVNFRKKKLLQEEAFPRLRLSQESIFLRRISFFLYVARIDWLDSSKINSGYRSLKVKLCAPSPTCITPQKNKRWGVRVSQMYPKYWVIAASTLSLRTSSLRSAFCSKRFVPAQTQTRIYVCSLVPRKNK